MEQTLLYAGNPEYLAVLSPMKHPFSRVQKMDSDNPTSADNQQERPSFSTWMDRIPNDLGHWIRGFVDGEGSFNIPIRRERDRGLPWRVALSFNVSQVGNELPELLQSTFGVGTVRDRGDGVHYFEVTRPSQLVERVFPFFDRFSAERVKERRPCGLPDGH